MSQEKVAKYKEQKANRKEILKKQKRQKMIANILVGVICAAIVIGIGYGVVRSVNKKAEGTSKSTIDISALEGFNTYDKAFNFDVTTEEYSADTENAE